MASSHLFHKLDMGPYYLLWPMADDSSRADRAWLDDFAHVNGNPCGHFNFKARPHEIVIENLGEDVPYNFVDRPPVGYIRSDLLEALSPDIQSLLTFGTLFDRNIGYIHNVKTITGGPEVYLRGGAQAQCWRCEVCNQLVYNPISQWHVLSSDLPDSPIFITTSGGIVVTEEIRRRLLGRRWKQLSIGKLPVRNKPLDGFPVNVNEVMPDVTVNPSHS